MKTSRWIPLLLLLVSALVIGGLVVRGKRPVSMAGTDPESSLKGQPAPADRALEKEAPSGKTAAAIPLPEVAAKPPQVGPRDRVIPVADTPTIQRRRNEFGQNLPLRERQAEAGFLDPLFHAAEGAKVEMRMFPDAVWTARVTGHWDDGSGQRVAAVLDGMSPRDRLFISVHEGQIRGLVELPTENRAFEISGEFGKQVTIKEWLHGEMSCSSPTGGGNPVALGLPRPEEAGGGLVAEPITTAEVPIHNSRPGAPAVIYLDFDGETVTGTAWNGGNTITAPSARMTPAEVTETWQRVSRDFGPYNVNVTTDRAVYSAASGSRRTHCVVTDDDTAAPGAGGVAYVGSFTNADPSFKICWSFIDNDARNCAIVISHEVGHTLSLRHDGRIELGGSPREEYYGGHGTGPTGWAPIMGVGYSRNLVHWSKGEYTRASNTEDDIAAITTTDRIPRVADDHGNTTATFTSATYGVAQGGIIESDTDVDVFRLTLPAGNHPVSVLLPVGTMLDVQLRVFDSNGTTLIATNNPVDDITATVTVSSTGSRVIFAEVSGVGKAGLPDAGYSDYSSLGRYTFTVPLNEPPTISNIADQTINEDTPTGAIAFTVGDSDVSADTLVMTGTSSNPALVPNGNLVFGGVAENRTLIVSPMPDQFGTATITVTVDDGGRTASDTFLLTVNPVNDAPTISAIASVSTNEDVATGAIAFNVADIDHAPAGLLVTGVSGNTALVPNGNVVFGGAGNNRTVTVTPAANQFGTAIITVTVSDGTLTSLNTFTVTVNPVNDAPTLSGISNRSSPENAPVPAIPLIVGDVETAAGSLTLSVTSGNITLVPTANLSFGGSGANRTLLVVPAANRVGTVRLTVTVQDEALTATQAFDLAIFPVNDAPSDVTLNPGAIVENLPGHALVGQLGTVDPDTGDIHAYSLALGAGDQDNQSIILTDNRLALKHPANFEQKSSYRIRVRVADNGTPPYAFEKMLVIPVSDGADAPAITSFGGAVSARVVAGQGSTTVSTVTATDEDQPPQVLTYEIAGGADQSRFTVDGSTGVVSFAAVPNPASPQDANRDNIYEVQVSVRDTSTPTPLTDLQSWSVIVPPGGRDLQAPVIAILEPSGAGAATVPRSYKLSGTIRDQFGLQSVTVRVNGRQVSLDHAPEFPLMTTSAQPVSWRVTGVLAENGPNLIQVEATDLNGRIGRASRTVYYSEPAIAQLAGRYEDLLGPIGLPSLDTFGQITTDITRTGAFSGRVTLGGTSQAFSGFLSGDGTARFATGLTDRLALFAGSGTSRRSLGFLRFSVSPTEGLSGSVTDSDDSTVLARAEARKSPYNAVAPVPSSFLNRSDGIRLVRGTYNVVFGSETQAPTRLPSTYPQGDGFGVIRLSRDGNASLTGTLADASPVFASGRLRADGSLSLYVLLYTNLGAMGGEISFPQGAGGPVTAPDFLWMRPEQPASTIYPDGWPGGLTLDTFGGPFAPPRSLDFGQGPGDRAAGNASLTFEGGLLTLPLVHPVNVSPSTGTVSLIPKTAPPYRFELNAANGRFSGTITHEDSSRPTFRGVLIPAGSRRGGYGYFLSIGPGQESGSVFLDPNGPGR